MFLGDQGQEVGVDGLNAHFPGSIVRRAVTPQVRDDEPIPVLEGIGQLGPFIRTRSRRTVHAQHRGTGSPDLVVEVLDRRGGRSTSRPPSSGSRGPGAGNEARVTAELWVHHVERAFMAARSAMTDVAPLVWAMARA